MTYFIFFFQNRSAVSGRFRDGFGTVSGRFLGPRGVQIPLTMELKDNGRWRPRVLDELCRSIFPYNRTNFGGSPRTKEYNYSKPRSRRGPRWEDRRRRGLPIRPYLHARMPRITAVEQLPQMSQKLWLWEYRVGCLDSYVVTIWFHVSCGTVFFCAAFCTDAHCAFADTPIKPVSLRHKRDLWRCAL